MKTQYFIKKFKKWKRTPGVLKAQKRLSNPTKTHRRDPRPRDLPVSGCSMKEWLATRPEEQDLIHCVDGNGKWPLKHHEAT